MEESAFIKARRPRGFRDLFGDDLVLRRRMVDTIGSVYERYGFTPLETPSVEYAEVLGKYLPESDAPQGGIFAFRDDSNDWLGLRYDLTAPLSRVVAEYADLPLPYRRYHVGPVFRVEKPGPGRYREFYQCDFDTVGTDSPAADAEVCCVLADAMRALGIERGKYVVRVNDRKVLNGVLERAGLNVSEGSGGRVLTVMRAIDKLDRVGQEGVVQLLGEGRRDPSGDFTPGARLEPAQVRSIVDFLELPRSNRAALVSELSGMTAGSAVGEGGVEELRRMDELLTRVGYAEDEVIFDPTVVRGLAYYTGPVFEVELTFETRDESGQVQRFGSVAGGGRYDDLVQRFLGRAVPATGASIGVDRLQAALQALGSFPGAKVQASTLVVVMNPAEMAEAFALAAELRAGGIPSEVFLGTGGMKAQMKYADRRAIRIAVIVGEDERKAGTVSIKDLKKGEELSKDVADRKTWQRDRPAQVTVPRAQMMETIRGMLEGNV